MVSVHMDPWTKKADGLLFVCFVLLVWFVFLVFVFVLVWFVLA